MSDPSYFLLGTSITKLTGIASVDEVVYLYMVYISPRPTSYLRRCMWPPCVRVIWSSEWAVKRALDLPVKTHTDECNWHFQETSPVRTDPVCGICHLSPDLGFVKVLPPSFHGQHHTRPLFSWLLFTYLFLLIICSTQIQLNFEIHLKVTNISRNIQNILNV